VSGRKATSMTAAEHQERNKGNEKKTRRFNDSVNMKDANNMEVLRKQKNKPINHVNQ